MSPARIAVVGGGRWAREYAKELARLVPSPVGISVHSPHNAAGMSAWAAATFPAGRIAVSSEWPELGLPLTALIVVNGPRDHEGAVERGIRAGWPVLVEKPMAATATGAESLVMLARRTNVRLAAVHLLLFATYIRHYARIVADTGPLRSVRIHWSDPRNEIRYGEEKRYDGSLPVYADWMPHVCALLSALEPGAPTHFERLTVLRGGAHLKIDLRAGDTPVNVEFVRDSDQRRRIIEVDAAGETVRIDSSQEPGTITRGSVTAAVDSEWETGPRPMARMLTAFLAWAAGGDEDPRLSSELAVLACRLVDHLGDAYRSIRNEWLLRRLADGGPLDDSLRYALSEVLQAEGGLAAAVIDNGMKRIMGGLAGSTGAALGRRLADAKDPGAELRAFLR